MNTRPTGSSLAMISCCALALFASACMSNVANQDSVSGSATYRERIALPPDAVFEATLEDVSRADAAADILGTTRIPSPGRVPIRFTIDYDAARIDPSHRYAVRARILADDRLLFTSDSNHPVLTQGNTNIVEIVMRRPDASPPQPSAAPRASSAMSTATLINTYWKFVQVNGAPVTVSENQREPHIVLHTEQNRVAGSGGCNGMGGTYELEGDLLKFSRMLGTMMACDEGMEQELAIHDALSRVANYRITGEQLELFDSAGAQVAVLESVYLR